MFNFINRQNILNSNFKKSDKECIMPYLIPTIFVVFPLNAWKGLKEAATIHPNHLLDQNPN